MKRKAFPVVLFLTLMALLLMISTVIWGMNKGFDLTDEGLYLLRYQENHESFVLFSHYHTIVRFFFGWIDLNVINTRIIRLVLTLLSPFIFASGLIRWIQKSNAIQFKLSTKVFIIVLIAIGSFISYTFGAQSLSYNHILIFCLSSSTGLMFYATAAERNAFTHLFLGLAGFFTGIIFFVKITSALAFLLLLTIFLVLYFRKTGHRNFKSLGTLYIGFFAFPLIYFLFISDFQSYVQNFKEVIKIYNSSASKHNIGFYTSDILETLAAIAESVVFSLGILFTVIYARNTYWKIKANRFRHSVFVNFIIILVLLGLIYLAVIFLKKSLYLYFSGPYLLIIIFVLSLSIINFKRRNLKIPSETWLIAGLFFLLPFAGAFGTSNGMIINSIYFTTFWFSILIVLHYSKTLVSSTFYIFTSILILFSIVDFYRDYVNDPYRQEPLPVQTETLSNLPNGKNIHVDAKRHKYLTDIYSTLKKNGYEQHDPIIGIYKIPGIIYLMDGTAPSRAIWSRESDQEFLVSLKYYDGKLENSILILTEECSDKLKEGLQKHGVVFPEDYVLKGSVQYEGYPLTNIFFPEK